MNRIKVLIIDDEKEVCDGLKLYLEDTKKFDALTAASGIAGFHLAKSKKPDIILLDIIMPDLTGADLAEELLADEDTKDIPIIFLTALMRKREEKKLGGRLMKYHIIAKPVNVNDLIERIENIVEESGQ